MSSTKYRDSQFVQLEQDVHAALTPWISSYKDRSGGEFTDIGYDPNAYPEQRLDVAYSPAKQYPRFIPGRLMLKGLEKALLRHVGSKAQLNSLVKSFRQTPASAGSQTSIAGAAAKRLDNGEAIGVLVDHTEQGDLRDVGLVMGILILAMANNNYRQRAAFLVGLNMSRQAYRGRTVAQELTKAAGIIWVMQDSENRRALDIPKEGVETVNRGAFRALMELRKQGLMLGIVPSGTAMKLVKTEAGEQLVRPEIAEGTMNIMSGLDALLPVGMHQGRIRTGPLYAIEAKGLSKRDRRLYGLGVAEMALHSLAEHNASLANLPVNYRDSHCRSITVNP
ncbi:hypothetical protein A3F65_00130 [Candidatus Saccharibacteria bacterium RIFCSPHIGHO2_12_FULL_47_16b]|nr:MAG: hypothetical protein A3F65_00130 [Candidatus Saccharibacteria bacterium RIFCSPHIGHO2_12_FULL_47_16b]